LNEIGRKHDQSVRAATTSLWQDMTTPPTIPVADGRPARLSDNAQFQDKPGACKLIETAVSRGDQAMAARRGG